MIYEAMVGRGTQTPKTGQNASEGHPLYILTIPLYYIIVFIIDFPLEGMVKAMAKAMAKAWLVEANRPCLGCEAMVTGHALRHTLTTPLGMAVRSKPPRSMASFP